MTGSEADKKLLQLYLNEGRRLTFRKGELIIGHNGTDYAFYLQEGFARSYSINNRGDEYTHLIYGAGDMFPVYRLFEEGSQVFFEALNNVTVYRLPRKVIRELVPDDSAITYALLRASVKTARIFTNRIRNLEYRYASERIIYRLLLLCDRFGRQLDDGSFIIEIPLPQQIFASSINVSRESVSRTFEHLKQKDLVEYNSHYVIIKDPAALERQLGTATEI